MKKLHCSPQFMVVQQLKDALDAGGIECVILNKNLAGTAGELTPSECWAELWVLDDAKYQIAAETLARLLSEAEMSESKGTWGCPRCGEELDGRFTECWRCGASRADEFPP